MTWSNPRRTIRNRSSGVTGTRENHVPVVGSIAYHLRLRETEEGSSVWQCNGPELDRSIVELAVTAQAPLLSRFIPLVQAAMS
jgi:hypothetical protein